MNFGKIYTFVPSFRAECSNPPRHVAEFWHVEPEVTFAELTDVIELVEDVIKHVVKAAIEECPTELEFFDKNFEKDLIDKLKNLVTEKLVLLPIRNQLKSSKGGCKVPISRCMRKRSSDGTRTLFSRSCL